MSARGKQRQVLFERAMRIVARTRNPESGVNVVDIAWWLLSSDTEKSARHLAESYYQRLDRAERNPGQERICGDESRHGDETDADADARKGRSPLAAAAPGAHGAFLSAAASVAAVSRTEAL